MRKFLESYSRKHGILIINPHHQKKSPSQLKSFNTCIYEILCVLYHFLYYLGLVPLKLLGNQRIGHEIELVTSPFRQGVSYTVHLLGLVGALLTSIRTITGPTIKDDPNKLFGIAEQSTYVLTLFAFTSVCFSKDKGLKKLLEVTFSFHGLGDGEDLKSVRKFKILGIFLCVGWTLNTLRMVLAYGGFLGKDGFRMPSLTFYCENAYSTLGLGFLEGKGSPEGHIGVCTSETWKTVLTSLYFLATVSLGLMSSFMDGFILFITLTAYILSKDFMKLVSKENGSTITLEQICYYYRQMKSLVGDMNEVSGVALLLYTTAAIPFYASHFIMILDSPGVSPSKLSTLYYLSTYLVSLSLAAQAHFQMERFPNYVYKNFSNSKSFQRQDMELFTMEIRTTKIGLKGGGFFMVTYSFLGNVMGVLFTYIIIIIQFQT